MATERGEARSAEPNLRLRIPPPNQEPVVSRMDRLRIKSKAAQIKRPAIVASAVVALVTVGVILANINFSTHPFDRTKLSTETLQQPILNTNLSPNHLPL